MKLLAVDPGGRRYGLAVADGTTGLATPAGIHTHRDLNSTAETIEAEARRRGVTSVVIGLPLSADGTETSACRRSRALAEHLARMGLKVDFQPEFLTSHAARERALDVGRSRDRPVDDLAAQIILEDYLAAHPGPNTSER